MEEQNTNQSFDRTQAQMKILSEISEICLSLNASFWLRGGWAIDFLLGRITRPHSDIDLVTWIQYRGQLEKALGQAGFRQIPISEFQTDFLKDDVDVSFVFVRLSDDGSITANGFLDWVWRPDALPTRPLTLHGISVHVLSPHQLIEEKEVYEQGTGRKPRPKDFESMKIIREIIDAR